MSEHAPFTIAHISDLHCGSRYHIPSLATRVVDELNELRPDMVVVTGDLTDMGFRQEFKQAQRLLDGIDCPDRLVVMGNHDARNVGDEHFAEMFGARSRELRSKGIRVLGLDSSEPDLDSGRVGRERYRWIEERFSEPDEFKVVCMHHHLVPVPGTGRERNIVYDAGDLLRVLSNCGADLVLCGHKHVPNVWRLEDMLIVNAGTACSHRLRGRVRPCYNIIEVHERRRVRVLLKEPFAGAECVADFQDVHQKYCRWRSPLSGEVTV
ncbi:MAG TPA: metallophosphoesterase [Coriobacteriia bacterium]|nr:metallophosphoesterase [Coriobacteriia bacterium]